MEQKTLKYLRVLIPGFIILIFILPASDQLLGQNIFINFEYEYLVILALIIGSIYYQLNIQHIITKPSHYFITNNIFNKLLKCLTDNISKEAKKKIKKERLYMQIFYKIVDNDETLKIRGEHVRFNGVFWTSSADTFIIGIIFFILYSINILIPSQEVNMSNFLLIIILLSLLLHIISVINHIRLSNSQLNYIQCHKKDAVNKEFNSKMENLNL